MNELKQALIRNRKLLLWSFTAVAAVCWFLGSSFISLVHNKLEFKRLTKLSTQLDQEYDTLKVQLDLLQKQDPVYIERVARVKYHMSRPGEIEYRFTVEK